MPMSRVTVIVVSLLHVTAAFRQCDTEFPDGSPCGAGDYATQADPDLCYMYYQCDDGCVHHEECPDDNKWDARYHWCTYPTDVECGDRDCPSTSQHCPEPTTRPTPTTRDPDVCMEWGEKGCETDSDCCPGLDCERHGGCGPGGCGHIDVCVCNTKFPDGTTCGAGDYATQADPNLCYMYYQCDDGCVTHEECPGDNKYDDRYHWCTYPQDVECGDRDCPSTSHHCPEPTTRPTTTEDCSSTPPLDCDALGAGYYPDPDNCRKYWHCIKGGGSKHILCPDDEQGNPEMYSTIYDGCDYRDNVKCDGRPICDECNNNCEATPTLAPDCTPEDQKIDCSELGAGWHPDPYNCRRYWHCLKENSEPEHLLCDLDEHGEFMVWDMTYDGCNYLEQTNCGDRPICDECNNGCWDVTTDHPTQPIDCGHDLDCTNKPDGWYADPYSCVKYWNCIGGQATHHMCDEGLFYEPVKVQCDYEDRVNCGNRPHCNECDDGCP